MTLKILIVTFIFQFIAPIAIADLGDLTGEYRVNLDIEGRVFVDELILSKDDAGKYIGVYKVPGSFESEVLEFKREKSKFQFKIHVIEGNEDYHSLFTGEIAKDGLSGSAYILPTMKLLGTFKGEKL